MESIEPALPIERMDPALPIESIEPALPILNTEPALPMLRTLPTLAMLPTLHRLRMLRRLPALSRPTIGRPGASPFARRIALLMLALLFPAALMPHSGASRDRSPSHSLRHPNPA
jgi:hypothetical protein